MYAAEITETSKSALLELGLSLRTYHDDLVLSGGWAPYFIIKDFFEHCGSVDIDLVLKTRIIPKYETIRKILISLGYNEEDRFRFSRIIKSPIDGKHHVIHVDFLCDQISKGDFLKVQPDLEAFMFPGADIAFDFNFEKEIETTLPGNGIAKTTFKILDLTGSITLKGQALNGRYNPKDAYDVFALTHYNGGPKQAAHYFNQSLSNKKLSGQKQELIRNSILIIREKFKDQNRVGSFQVETFSENKYRRNIVATQVNQFLRELHIDLK